MLFIYNFALIILTIVFSPAILIAFILQSKFRAGFWQKIGFYKLNLKNRPAFLFHAVSVGEVNAIEFLIKKTRKEFPEHNIVLSTVTKTGQQVAINKLKNIVDEIIYFPYDFSFSVNSCLNAIKPQKIIIAETEIWPNFVSIAKNKGIDVIISNGRISPNSHKGYKKIKFFLKNIFSKYKSICMQTKDDASRIIDIGASEKIVEVMGNLKFDIEKTLSPSQIEALKNEFELNQNRLIVFASTHSGEDEICLSVFKKLKQEFPDIKMLIAPRHPQRYEKVTQLIENSNFSFAKRSEKGNFKNNEIILLDTMGELSKIYSICFCAFIGGSFANTGGHNPLEVSIWGKPVLSGPIVFNFKDIYKQLTQFNVAKIVQNENELVKKIDILLQDNSHYEQICNKANKVFETNKGAVQFMIEKLKEV